MPLNRMAIVLVAGALAAAPASALADGAGDQQYQDPLTAPSTPKKAKKKRTTAPAAAAPTTSTPAAATAPAASSGESAVAGGSAELPRTGVPAGAIGLAGGLMLLCGVALRRRTISS